MALIVANIVCSHYPPHAGGVERFAYNQAHHLSKLGYSVNVITDDTERVGFYKSENGASVYRLSSFSLLKNNRLPVPFNLAEWFKIFCCCFKGLKGVTIVHTRYFPICLMAAILARASHHRLVLIDHSSDFISFGRAGVNKLARAYEWSMTLALRLFQPIFVGVSWASCEWLTRFGIRAAGVYYNGIDIRMGRVELSDVPANRFAGKKIALVVSRLLKEKAILETIEGFERFVTRRPNWVLVIIGTGELATRVAEKAKCNNSVIYLGRQDSTQVFSYLHQADVLVNASNYPEGLPTVLLEAGVCALPVISTPRGGVVEVIEEGLTGYLIPSGSPQLVEAALERVASDPAGAAILGRNLRARVLERFDFAENSRRFAEQYLAPSNP